jgi:hypothetical protein
MAFRFGGTMRLALFLVVVLLPTAVIADSRPMVPPVDERASPDHPGWSIDVVTGCWIWNPEPGDVDVFHWSGGCDATGKISGKGKLEWNYDGDQLDRYEGEYRAGKMEGIGTYFWANGKRYEGPWRAGERHGKGKYFWPDGKRFEGTWKNGSIEGPGVAIYPDGTRYDGVWKANAQNGQGTMTYANGNRYEGGWKDGAFDGYGTMTWSNGDRYQGYWRDGKSNGPGTEVFHTGNRYKGMWKNDRPHGRGEYWDGDDHYVGEWSDGCFLEGTAIFAIGRTLKECADAFDVNAEPK